MSHIPQPEELAHVVAGSVARQDAAQLCVACPILSACHLATATAPQPHVMLF